MAKPHFFFQVDEIGESPYVRPHYDSHSTWTPSTEPGANINVTAGSAVRHISGKTWFCNQLQIYEVPQRPATALPYKTFSVYYVAGAGFYVLKGDARYPPGDDVFHRLQFSYHNNSDCSSYLTNAGQYPTLRLQPQNPNWAKLVLPNIYHSTATAPDPPYGGLVGELPIFLALMAFSTTRELIPDIMPHLFTGGCWVKEHDWQMQLTDKRGLVVSVYTCPPGYSTTSQQVWAAGSTGKDLENYEMGVFGKYFY